jgi:hypothetical protein
MVDPNVYTIMNIHALLRTPSKTWTQIDRKKMTRKKILAAVFGG